MIHILFSKSDCISFTLNIVSGFLKLTSFRTMWVGKLPEPSISPFYYLKHKTNYYYKDKINSDIPLLSHLNPNRKGSHHK